MRMPRVIISATGSGSGKTLITCGILQALMNRKMKVASFKCGPDYIDPMFHSKVIGEPCKNLDTFFTDTNTTRYLFGKVAKDAEISVIEGVMGFYDGVAGISHKASSYHMAKTLQAPVVLIINCKGMSCSIVPMIKGFLEYEKDSNIKGVILNQISPMLYKDIKILIEEKLPVSVIGYVPNVSEFVIESRHLGLVTPDDIEDIQVRLKKLAEVLEETINIDLLLFIANQTEELEYEDISFEKVYSQKDSQNKAPRIAVAKDEAFCFYYRDNLELLEELGASLVFFSPIRDKALPDNIDGILLGGGYPEIYAKELSENISMIESMKRACNEKIPCIGECGGFMYLHEELEDMEGKNYSMVGLIKGKAYKTNKLSRFGYIELKSNQEDSYCAEDEVIKAHEFHYWDSTSCGTSFIASKPLRTRTWECIHENDWLLAGYPHLYYYSNPMIPRRFLEKCLEYRSRRG